MTTSTYHTATNRSMSTCLHCGMRGDLDPFFHEERYGHWPILRTAEGGTTSAPVWTPEPDDGTADPDPTDDEGFEPGT